MLQSNIVLVIFKPLQLSCFRFNLTHNWRPIFSGILVNEGTLYHIVYMGNLWRGLLGAPLYKEPSIDFLVPSKHHAHAPEIPMGQGSHRGVTKHTRCYQNPTFFVHALWTCEGFLIPSLVHFHWSKWSATVQHCADGSTVHLKHFFIRVCIPDFCPFLHNKT